jgi:hypothetical protein
MDKDRLDKVALYVMAMLDVLREEKDIKGVCKIKPELRGECLRLNPTPTNEEIKEAFPLALLADLKLETENIVSKEVAKMDISLPCSPKAKAPFSVIEKGSCD